MAAARRGTLSRLSEEAPRPATPAERRALDNLPTGSIGARLVAKAPQFNFFQAVRLLERIDPDRAPVGYVDSPAREVVRFRALVSTDFPPSALRDIAFPKADLLPPEMTVTFFGLHGPSGILPRHYTEQLMRLLKEARGAEKTALRDWFDLFNHRLISLFYRAWTKYRFWVNYERRETRRGTPAYEKEQPDSFTQALYSLVGFGTQGLRNRLRVAQWEDDGGLGRARTLANIDDLALIFYSGLLAQRPRSAVALRGILQDFFALPIEIKQFQGQWLQLDPSNQSCLADRPDANNLLGINAVAGERVWDVIGKIRIRVGPLSFSGFTDFLPDRAAVRERKAFFLLVHLVRLFIGTELTFDVQLLLKADAVPECQLSDDEETGPRLGWNTWISSREPTQDVQDAVFEGEELAWVNDEQRLTALASRRS